MDLTLWIYPLVSLSSQWLHQLTPAMRSEWISVSSAMHYLPYIVNVHITHAFATRISPIIWINWEMILFSTSTVLTYLQKILCKKWLCQFYQSFPLLCQQTTGRYSRRQTPHWLKQNSDDTGLWAHTTNSVAVLPPLFVPSTSQCHPRDGLSFIPFGSFTSGKHVPLSPGQGWSLLAFPVWVRAISQVTCV